MWFLDGELNPGRGGESAESLPVDYWDLTDGTYINRTLNSKQFS